MSSYDVMWSNEATVDHNLQLTRGYVHMELDAQSVIDGWLN